MNPITILPHGKKLQVAYKLRLLDLALIRSNGPDEVMTRTIKNNSGVIEDRFVIPSSKIRHAMREAVEIVQRTFDIAVTCRAQNYCSACPACWMFGTLGSTGENRKNWSMTSHLEMAEAISLTGGSAVEMRTTNSVDPETMQTNQALTRNFAVPAGTEFYGTITLTTNNPDAVRIALSALLGITRIGARSSNHGLCDVEILGVRESFFEDPRWSPQIVVETGVIPIGDVPIVKSMHDHGVEDAFVEAIRRFNKDVVQPTVSKLSGPVNDVAKPVAELLAQLAKAETGQLDHKGLMSALKKLSKSVTDDEVLESLKSVEADLNAAGKVKGGEKELHDVILVATQSLREAIGTLGLASV